VWQVATILILGLAVAVAVLVAVLLKRQRDEARDEATKYERISANLAGQLEYERALERRTSEQLDAIERQVEDEKVDPEGISGGDVAGALLRHFGGLQSGDREGLLDGEADQAGAAGRSAEADGHVGPGNE